MELILKSFIYALLACIYFWLMGVTYTKALDEINKNLGKFLLFLALFMLVFPIVIIICGVNETF